jgi:hypothetical protein
MCSLYHLDEWAWPQLSGSLLCSHAVAPLEIDKPEGERRDEHDWEQEHPAGGIYREPNKALLGCEVKSMTAPATVKLNAPKASSNIQMTTSRPATPATAMNRSSIV